MVIGTAFIIIIGCSIAVMVNRELVETLPVVLFQIIVVLYAFYCMNLLWIGYWIVIGSGLLLILFGIRLLMKDPLVFNIINPSTLCLIISTVFVIVYTANSKVSLWDEFRLWAAYPKALYYSHRLQLVKGDTWLFENMRGYLPGMPLLCYFFERSNLRFSEWTLFYVYGFMSTSILCSGLRLNKKIHLYFVPCLAIGIVLIPKLFFNPIGNDYQLFYKSLFVDPVVGLIAGYAIINGINAKCSDCWGLYKLSISATALVLLKESGIGMALICLLICTIKVAKERAGDRIRFFFYTILAPFIATATWWWLRFTNQIHHAVSFEISVKRLLDRSFLCTFITELFKGQYYDFFCAGDIKWTRSFILQYTICVCFSFVMYYLLYRSSKEFLWIIIGSNIMLLFYLAGYYITCAFGYKGKVLSLSRYMGCMLLMYVTVIWLYWTMHMDMNQNKRKLFLLGVLGLYSLPFMTATLPRGGFAMYSDVISQVEVIEKRIMEIMHNSKQTREDSVRAERAFLQLDKWGEDLGVYAWVHHKIYYDMMENGLIIGNYYDSAVNGWENDNDEQYKYLIVCTKQRDIKIYRLNENKVEGELN